MLYRMLANSTPPAQNLVQLSVADNHHKEVLEVAQGRACCFAEFQSFFLQSVCPVGFGE